MAEKHLIEQKKHTISYLIPYFENLIPDLAEKKILEIGCAEGGFLDVFDEYGYNVSGIELSPNRAQIAKKNNPNLKIIVGDITDENIVNQIDSSFDLIVLRDVIEHIPNRKKMFENIDKLLKNYGYLYITFPPKYSSFSGHQQNGASLIKYIPYIQFLPNWFIRLCGRFFKERQNLISAVILNFKNGLTIKEFKKYLKMYNLTPIKKDLFIIRPIYKTRYNLNPLKIPHIPILNEFLTFGCEYLLKK